MYRPTRSRYLFSIQLTVDYQSYHGWGWTNVLGDTPQITIQQRELANTQPIRVTVAARLLHWWASDWWRHL